MGRWITALRLVGVGFFVAGSILLGVLGGLWVDNALNTTLLWIIGLVLGIIVAFWGVYQMLLPFLRNKQDKENS